MRKYFRKILCKSSIGSSFVKRFDDFRYARALRVNNALQNRCLHKYGYEAAGIIAKTVKKLEIRSFADFGTLLGVIRDGGFVEHDLDMDFSVFPETCDYKRLASALLSEGFEFIHAFLYEGAITEVTVRYKGVPIDFFAYLNDGEEFYTQVYTFNMNEGDAVHRPGIRQFRPRIANLVTLKVHDISFLVPSNYEEVLTMQYGNWKMPNREWDYAKQIYGRRQIALSGFAEILDWQKFLSI